MSHPIHNPVLAEWISTLLNTEPLDPLFPALQDGVILCNLIDHINGTQRQPEVPCNIFKKMTNISYFLDGCIAAGVPSYERFESNDLIQERYKTVEMCLLSLSRNAFRLNLIGVCAGPKLNDKVEYNHDRETVIKGKIALIKEQEKNRPGYPNLMEIPRQIVGQQNNKSSEKREGL